MASTSVTSVNAGVTTTGRNEDTFGARRVGLYRVTLADSYLAGGDAFDPRAYGFDKPVATVFLTVRSVAAAITRRFEYDFTNKKIKAIVTSTGAQVADGQDLSTIVIDVLVVSE